MLRADNGVLGPGASVELRGAGEVARRALLWSRVDLTMHPVLINGAAGYIATRDGQPFSLMAVAVRAGKIAEMYILADPERLRQLDLTSSTT